jgi:hypothetical protein
MEEKVNVKPKLLFVYDLENPTLWKDGLWAALKLLEKDFDIWWENLQTQHSMIVEGDWDFILGWGGFNSSVDRELSKEFYKYNKKGLCIGGNAFPYHEGYDVLFYETEWAKDYLKLQGNLVHAFGVNTDIYHQSNPTTFSQEIGEQKINVNEFKVFDYITVGAFAKWKRQGLLLTKPGLKMAVGQIQKNNLNESIDIVGELLLSNCMVSDMVSPETLSQLYSLSKTCYIPADIMGGGERAVLEARACGINVEIENDNPKLKELLSSPVWDAKYYAQQLKEGILKCI